MGFWSRLWGGVKRVARRCYRAVRRVVTRSYRAVKRTTSRIWNGVKTCYRTVKSGISTATKWVFDKVRKVGTWTRNQLNKTWIGRQCVKAWDWTVGGGWKSTLKSAGNKVRNFLNKSAFGRGILRVYDGCASVVKGVYHKYTEAKLWCKSKLNNMGFVGELLSDAISIGSDVAWSYVTSGLGKLDILNKMKTLTQSVDLVNKIKSSSLGSGFMDKMNVILKNDTFRNVCDGYNKLDNYLCNKLDVIEDFVNNNDFTSAIQKFGAKLDQHIMQKIDEDDGVITKSTPNHAKLPDETVSNDDEIPAQSAKNDKSDDEDKKQTKVDEEKSVSIESKLVENAKESNDRTKASSNASVDGDNQSVSTEDSPVSVDDEEKRTEPDNDSNQGDIVDAASIGQDILNRDKKDQVNAVRDMYKNSIFQNQPDIPNFGGSMVLAVKNLKNNENSKLAACKELGFGILEKDHDKYEQSLVKLVKDKVVTIHSCKTHTTGGNPYRTELDIENNSDEKIDGLIPAGSVVAEQNQFREVQNLCAQQDYHVTLGPHQRNTFDVQSFCMDLDYACPAGESANFTPLMYQNMPLGVAQDAFWKWADQFNKEHYDDDDDDLDDDTDDDDDDEDDSKQPQISLSIHSATEHLDDNFKPENVLKTGSSFYFTPQSRNVFIIFNNEQEGDFYIPSKVKMKGVGDELNVKDFNFYVGSTEKGEWLKCNQSVLTCNTSYDKQSFDLLGIDVNRVKANKYTQYKLEMLNNHGDEDQDTCLTEFKLFGSKYE